MAFSYDKIEEGLAKAKAEAAKEGRTDYNTSAEIEVLYREVYVPVWKRLEQLQPGAYEPPTGGQDVRG